MHWRKAAVAAVNRPTFEALYRAQFTAVWNWLRRMGVPRDARTDAVQETFEIALRRWEQIDPARPPLPWLLGIAFRVVVAQRRKLDARAEFVDEVLESLDSGQDLERQLFNRQAREWVWKGLQTLNLEQRAVFSMCELEGLPVPEVAESLEIPLNTAYSRLRLAREKLEQWLTLNVSAGGTP